MLSFKSTNNIEEIKNRLNLLLVEEKSFLPYQDKIPKIETKGIYFWFMHPDGYNILNKYVKISPIESSFKRKNNGIGYDLVYIGTTGTGKQGKSSFYDRLNWHLNQPHSPSAICQKNSALSTLRTGISSLLSNDLIDPNTENIVNEFFKTFMKIYWIDYPDNKELIDNDESVLIQKLKPLFNLKKNPNALKSSQENSTIVYKNRRNEIEKSTKLRLGVSIDTKNTKPQFDLKKTSVITPINDSLKSKFENIVNTYNLNRLKNDSRPKLLIIGCSSSKSKGGTFECINYFDNNKYQEILDNRVSSFQIYSQIIERNPGYFNKKREKIKVELDYFKNCVKSPLYKRAIDRYTGKYFTEELRNLYEEKIKSNSLHLLILSGLYGVLRYDDSIIDYHLEITKNPLWKKKNDLTIINSIKRYIEENQIPEENVFYSLSKNGYDQALKPIKLWNNLWVNGNDNEKNVNLINSSRFLEEEFLPRL